LNKIKYILYKRKSIYRENKPKLWLYLKYTICIHLGTP